MKTLLHLYYKSYMMSNACINSWHINYLFVAYFLYYYGWLVGFYGISTIVGYLMKNPVYTSVK